LDSFINDVDTQNCLDEVATKKLKASPEFKDLVKKLLKKDPERRLGFKGVREFYNI
jgi:predicted phage-related endonuclease